MKQYLGVLMALMVTITVSAQELAPVVSIQIGDTLSMTIDEQEKVVYAGDIQGEGQFQALSVDDPTSPSLIISLTLGPGGVYQIATATGANKLATYFYDIIDGVETGAFQTITIGGDPTTYTLGQKISVPYPAPRAMIMTADGNTVIMGTQNYPPIDFTEIRTFDVSTSVPIPGRSVSTGGSNSWANDLEIRDDELLVATSGGESGQNLQIRDLATLVKKGGFVTPNTFSVASVPASELVLLGTVDNQTSGQLLLLDTTTKTKITCLSDIDLGSQTVWDVYAKDWPIVFAVQMVARWQPVTITPVDYTVPTAPVALAPLNVPGNAKAVTFGRIEGVTYVFVATETIPASGSPVQLAEEPTTSLRVYRWSTLSGVSEWQMYTKNAHSHDAWQSI